MTFSETFTRELGHLLDETFESVHGIYLDKGTSLCETLAAVPAEVASRPVSRRGTSVVAHVVHLTFYLDLLGRGLRGEAVGPVDWEETWRVHEATPAEWSGMQQHLTETYRKLRDTLDAPGVWEGENAVGDSIAIVAHTAYHLGAIRQMLLVTDAGGRDDETS